MTPIIRTALAGLALASLGLPAQATPTFDGEWSVQVSPQNGHCDQGYRVPITVANGDIAYSGRFNVEAQGGVDGAGGINVELHHGGDVVAASGRLGPDYGEGQWSSPTLNCSGTWMAQRS